MLKVILTIGGIQAIALVIQFARTKVVAMLLGPEGVGVVSTIDQIVQFAAFSVALSLPFASVKFLSMAHSKGDEAFRKSYAGFLTLLSAIALAGTSIVVTLIFLQPHVLGSEVAKYQTFVLIGVISMPALILVGFFTNVFASAQKYRASAALGVITNVATASAVIAGILTAGILGVFVGGTVAALLVTVASVVYLWKRMDLPFYSQGVDVVSQLRASPDVLSFAALLYFGSVSYSLSLLVARYAILSNFGEADAGLLQGAIVLSVAIGMVLNPANGLYLTPIMNRDIPKEDKIAAATKFQRRMVMILGLVSLPVVMFPQLLLTIMFSNKFASVGHIVFLFVFAQILTQLSGINQAILIGVDDLKVYAVITTAGQFAFGVLAWILAPAYGIAGVAYGSIASAIAIFAVSLIRLKLKHGFWPPRNLRWLVGFTLSSVLIVGWVSGLTTEIDVLSAVLKCVLLLTFVGVLFLFLNSQERITLRRMRVEYLFGK